MRDVLILILGAALTLVGTTVAQMLQSSNNRQQWILERDEHRLQQAATDLGRVRTFLEEYSPDKMLLFFDPKRTVADQNARIEQWREIRPALARLPMIDRSLVADVNQLVKDALTMIDGTGESMMALVRNQGAIDPIAARTARLNALALVDRLADRLPR